MCACDRLVASTTTSMSALRFLLVSVALCCCRSGKSGVRSPADAPRWAEYVLQVVQHSYGMHDIHRMDDSGSRSTLSSAFSGVGGLDITSDVLGHALKYVYGSECKSSGASRMLWACERRVHSRQGLMLLLGCRRHKSCIFENTEYVIADK